MRKGEVQYANFICTFGADAGFLDYDQITVKAFTNDTYVRRYGDVAYHLYEAQLITLEEVDGTPVLAIAGHFVKNAQLAREQLFIEKQGLVADSAMIETSPSAYFMLILNYHRLIYFGETRHAPELKSFEATMTNFIRRSWDEWIRENASGRRANSIKSLKKRVPKPVVNVVPLAERDAISSYIDRFASINTLRFRLIKPNHEIDASAAVSAVRSRFGALDPERLDLNASSSVGLQKEQVKELVGETTTSGNTEVRITGVDTDGQPLKGNNDEFALSSHLDASGASIEDKQSKLYRLFKGQLAAGKIRLGSVASHTADKLRSLATLL